MPDRRAIGTLRYAIPAIAIVFLLAAGIVLVQAFTITQKAPAESTAPAGLPGESIAALQERIDSGQIKLEFDEKQGYLRSLLQNLHIPISSQSLVFSKSSSQIFLISPAVPRALYFNDDVYVGYVQGAPHLEIASIDPETGPVFYILDQQKAEQPKLQPELSNCTVCHNTFTSEETIPRLLMLSVLADPTGVALNRDALITNDESPLRERWGGWYVTGTHGSQRHLGNYLVRTPAERVGPMKNYIAQADLTATANVTDLTGRFDTKPYLAPSSDIVALMILGHQTHVQNLMTVAMRTVRPDSDLKTVETEGEALVKAMLFAEEAPLTEAIKGTTDYAATFSSQGPRDSRGRSLRELDLTKRLFRYPMSYLVHSKLFDGMPQSLREYVYRRFREILTGDDRDSDYAHLSDSDRAAVLEILRETKPDFAAFLTR